MISFIASFAIHAQGPDLVSRVRAALIVPGSRPWAQTTLTGQASQYGVEGKYSLRFTQDGRFVQSIVDQLGEANGFDGTRHWESDSSGATRVVGFEDADQQKGMAMMLTDYWIQPNATVDIKADGNLLHVKLRNSLFEETVEIDPATSLPISASFLASSGKVVLVLSDWRPAGAFRVPFKADLQHGGLTDIFLVNRAKGSGDPGAAAYAMPSWIPTDVTFDASKPSAVESKKAFTGHMLVHPLVNGKDVGWFILDTGAEIMVINPKVADTLGMPKIGQEQLVGVGGSTTASFRTAKDFTLGPATIKNVKFIEFDLGQLDTIFRVKVAGIVGFDFFRRTIVGVNLSKPEVTVFDPATYKLPAGDWTAMQFDSGNPVAEARFEGDRKAFFRLDTGANGTVTFHAPYVEHEHLLDGRTTTTTFQGGVGGMTSGRLGKLTWFEIGGHRFENPSATFSQAKVGAFTSRYLAGNIGQDFMTPFNMVFDFGGSRVGFVVIGDR